MKTGIIVRIILVALMILPHPISPAVIVVDDTCSLANAISAANTDSATGGCPAGSGADELQLTGDVALLEVLPSIVSSITVEGNDFTVARDDAAPAFRIFLFKSGALTLRSVTVSNGDAGSDQGGGILHKSSYALHTTLTLENSTVSGNAAAGGGGIFQEQYSTLTLENSTVSGNAAISGGGIQGERYSSTTLTNSTVSDNIATLSGGGLRFDGGGLETYDVKLINSTVAGNSAGTEGGGIWSWYWHDVIAINSTISGNTAGSSGGGIFLGWKSEAELINSTIVGNSAPVSGGVADYYGFNIASGSVFGYNAGGSCGGLYQPFDDGGNLDDDGSCGGGFGDLTGLDPVLADNGGPTLTHALLEGSSAIDAAGDCGLATDQRGFLRDDGSCDSGSFEFDAGEPCVLRLRVASPVLQPGGTLEFDLFLQHNRPATVTVPFRIWVEEQDGSFIVGTTTPPITFSPGDSFRRRLTLALPESLASGRYFVRAKIDQMQQGLATARTQILVTE